MRREKIGSAAQMSLGCSGYTKLKLYLCCKTPEGFGLLILTGNFRKGIPYMVIGSVSQTTKYRAYK